MRPNPDQLRSCEILERAKAALAANNHDDFYTYYFMEFVDKDTDYFRNWHELFTEFGGEDTTIRDWINAQTDTPDRDWTDLAKAIYRR